MIDTLKSWFGWGEEAAVQGLASPVKEAIRRARKLAEREVGDSLSHTLKVVPGKELDGNLGRTRNNSGEYTVFLSEEVTTDPVEAFTTYFHELMHRAGIFREGAAEWLAQQAAKLNGYTTQGVAYARQTRAFDELARAVSPVVSNVQAHFSDMLKFALNGESSNQAQVEQAFRKRGLSTQNARSKAMELIQGIA